MSSDALKFYIELPGEKVVGLFAQNNNVILLKPRDVFLKIEDNNIKEFHVSCSNENFYMPQYKCLRKEYKFLPSELVNLWIGKSFNKTIIIDATTKKGNKISFCKLPVKSLDSNSYSEICDTPAPIMLLVKCSASQTAREPSPHPQKSLNQVYTPLNQEDTPRKSLLAPVAVSNPTMISKNPWSITDITKSNSSHAWLRNQLVEDGNLLGQEEKEDTLIVETSADIFEEFIKDKLDFGKEYIIKKEAHPYVHSLIWSMLQEDQDKYALFKDLVGTTFRITCGNTKKGKHYYIVFSGTSSKRGLVKGPKYLAGSSKNNTVTAITVGFGSWGDTTAIARKNLTELRKPSTVAGRFFCLSLSGDTYSWLASGDKDAKNLITTLITTTMATVVSTRTAPLIAHLIWMGLKTVAIGVTFPTASVVIGGAIIAIGVSLLVDFALDKTEFKQKIYNLLTIFLAHCESVSEFYQQKSKEDPGFVLFAG